MKSEETERTEQQWEAWMGKLATDDYLIVDNFMSNRLFQNIQNYFISLYEEREFSKAAIGPSEQRQIESSIRGDFIYWLDRDKDESIAELFTLFDELVNNIKRHLFLSIADYEFHFALYPPKTRYEKHVDQFHGKSNRLLSVLMYLNEDWKEGDGGELKIYRPDGNHRLVAPVARRLVMFRSDTVEHEVMLTHTHRKSLTGWLLRQPSGLGYLS